MTSTRLRSGLYRVTTETTTYLIEDRWEDGSAYPWRLTDENAFHDPWRGDFATKREAMAEIAIIERNAA